MTEWKVGDEVMLGADGKYTHMGTDYTSTHGKDFKGLVGRIVSVNPHHVAGVDHEVYGTMWPHKACDNDNTHYVDGDCLFPPVQPVSDEELAAVLASIASVSDERPKLTPKPKLRVFLVYQDWAYDGTDIVGIASSIEEGKRMAEAQHKEPLTWKIDADGDAISQGSTPYIVEGYTVDG